MLCLVLFSVYIFIVFILKFKKKFIQTNHFYKLPRVTNQLAVITNNPFLLREVLQHVLQIAETF